MKNVFSTAARVWGLQLLLTLLSLLFITFDSQVWLQVSLNMLLLAGFAMMAYGEGCYYGERAATLGAQLDGDRAAGRAIDPAQEGNVWSAAKGIASAAIAAFPLLLIAVVNVATYVPITEDAQQASTQWMNVAARVLNMPAVGLEKLVGTQALNWLFLVSSLILPAGSMIGYLRGPQLRKKKLEAIAKGSSRKRRNLKVNKTRVPRSQKPEV